jgi:hypothetical protein
LDDAKANLGDAHLSVKLGLAAADLAIDTAIGECEFTAVDNLMDYQRLIASLAGDEPCQPAPLLLLFMRCSQVCMFQNAYLIVVLIQDIASRLTYSIDKPPDVMKLIKVCAEIGDYLEDVKGNLPVDALAPLSKTVDQGIRRMKHFLRKDVRLKGEFAEAKFRRVIAQFFALCTNLKRARSTARTIRWTCDIQDLLTVIAEAQQHMQTLPDSFKTSRLPLARALLHIDLLCLALAGVPAAVKAAFEEAAFAIAAAESPESAADAVAAARAGLTALKELTPSLKGAHDQVAVPPRKCMLDKLERLAGAVETYDAGPGLVEKRVRSLGMFPSKSGKVKMTPGATTLPPIGKTGDQ